MIRDSIKNTRRQLELWLFIVFSDNENPTQLIITALWQKYQVTTVRNH